LLVYLFDFDILKHVKFDVVIYHIYLVVIMLNSKSTIRATLQSLISTRRAENLCHSDVVVKMLHHDKS
jgi:hypothetical protein